MSHRAYSTPSTQAQVQRLLHDAHRAIADVRLDATVDPDAARQRLESLLDTLATWPSKHPLACADCGVCLPEFRAQVAPDTHALLCACCADARVEDRGDAVAPFRHLTN